MRRLTNHYATSVYKDGFLYGFHGRQEFGPTLRCVEFKTGKVRWEVDGFRAGTITLAGDHLIIVREGGEMILKLQLTCQTRFNPSRRQRSCLRPFAPIRLSPMDESTFEMRKR